MADQPTEERQILRENLVVSPFFESHRPTLAKLVRDVMETQVVVATHKNTLFEVARLMLDRQLGGMPVLDDTRKVVGVVSETDMLYRLKTPHGRILDALAIWAGGNTEREKAMSADVTDVMTRPAVTIGPEATLQQAAELLIDRRISRLPVVTESGQLVGLLTRSHIVRAIVEWAISNP